MVRGLVVVAITAVVVALAACASAPPASTKPFTMRVYQMAFLSVGPRHLAEDTPERKKLLEGHQANIRRLAADGKLLIAGPLDWPSEGKDAMVGIFIFDVATAAEAEALCKTDPTIAAGHFAVQVVPWYGPSGLTYDGRDQELARIRAGTATTPTLPK
jgi:uncharacterized protein YciI